MRIVLELSDETQAISVTSIADYNGQICVTPYSFLVKDGDVLVMPSKEPEEAT